MRSVTVSDVMAKHPPAIRQGVSVARVVDTLLSHHLTGLPVVDDTDRVIGFVSEQDCLAHLLGDTYYGEGAPGVEDVMNREALTVEADMLLVDLAERLLTSRPKIYPVTDEGRLVGMITRSLVVRALRDYRDETDKSR